MLAVLRLAEHAHKYYLRPHVPGISIEDTMQAKRHLGLVVGGRNPSRDFISRDSVNERQRARPHLSLRV